ncbi:hypothetical protein C0Q70_15876, partial [Pomacea canaliculata]
EDKQKIRRMSDTAVTSLTPTAVLSFLSSLDVCWPTRNNTWRIRRPTLREKQAAFRRLDGGEWRWGEREIRLSPEYEQSENTGVTEENSFLTLSRDLPLIDVGANVGLVALQPLSRRGPWWPSSPSPPTRSALSICCRLRTRRLVHVIQNRVVTRGTRHSGTQAANTSTLFTVNEAGRQFTHDLTWPTPSNWIASWRCLPSDGSTQGKIDVESHEGHVLAGSRDLWKTLDVPLVWMEWEHVKGRATFGGQFVVDFMTARNFRPHHVISGKLLEGDFMSWPFTVLWRR